ncbi:hypothetical protein D5S17_32720 [Pseudonocardiaceae bacterium YIM PH 21723]|nr:hypothetical protein D5S17_32720 [Pseudonocardiaceae bacterium YIM PH 21723]
MTSPGPDELEQGQPDQFVQQLLQRRAELLRQRDERQALHPGFAADPDWAVQQFLDNADKGDDLANSLLGRGYSEVDIVEFKENAQQPDAIQPATPQEKCLWDQFRAFMADGLELERAHLEQVPPSPAELEDQWQRFCVVLETHREEIVETVLPTRRTLRHRLGAMWHTTLAFLARLRPWKRPAP